MGMRGERGMGGGEGRFVVQEDGGRGWLGGEGGRKICP